MSLILNKPQNISHFSLCLGNYRQAVSGGRCGGEGGRDWEGRGGEVGREGRDYMES